jgi:hypothetical protein
MPVWLLFVTFLIVWLSGTAMIVLQASGDEVHQARLPTLRRSVLLVSPILPALREHAEELSIAGYAPSFGSNWRDPLPF